jgi:transcriptional regulator with XRE-family HTH domain
MQTLLFTIDNKMESADFGTQMKEAREGKGWSLAQLAQRVNLIEKREEPRNRGYYHQIETGKRHPKPDLRRAIAIVLELPLENPAGDGEFSHPIVRSINYKLLALGKGSEALLQDVDNYLEFRIEQLRRQERDEGSAEEPGPDNPS